MKTIDEIEAELTAESGAEVDSDSLLNVPINVTIEIGRVQLPIRQIMELQEGSVIELERSLDEPLDILVNGQLVAHGVVVLLRDRFGIQITDIISPRERARHIK